MNRLSWEEYFLGLVQLSAKRSEDPNTKVGAILVNDKNRVVGIGYNGMPDGMDFTWEREAESVKDTKYPYVIHAEINAILNSINKPFGSTMYTSLFPCSNCAKIIVQAGIKKIIYIDDKYEKTEDNEIAKFIFNKSKVDFIRGKNIQIQIKK